MSRNSVAGGNRQTEQVCLPSMTLTWGKLKSVFQYKEYSSSFLKFKIICIVVFPRLKYKLHFHEIMQQCSHEVHIQLSPSYTMELIIWHQLRWDLWSLLVNFNYAEVLCEVNKDNEQTRDMSGGHIRTGSVLFISERMPVSGRIGPMGKLGK